MPYDRLSEIDQGAVVENKRLGHALQLAQQMQALRDDRRSVDSPSRTNRGEVARAHHPLEGRRTARAMTEADFNAALARTNPGWNTRIAKQMAVFDTKR